MAFSICKFKSDSIMLMMNIDIRDLKSRGPKGPCQFDSGLGHSLFNPQPFILFIVFKI